VAACFVQVLSLLAACWTMGLTHLPAAAAVVHYCFAADLLT
jgi:hypothetical protein